MFAEDNAHKLVFLSCIGLLYFNIPYNNCIQSNLGKFIHFLSTIVLLYEFLCNDTAVEHCVFSVFLLSYTATSGYLL